MKTITGFFIAVILTGCAQRKQPLPSPPLPIFVGAIAKIKESIAPVVCVHQDPNSLADSILDSVEGTAFFLRTDGTFATAGHVVQALTATTRRSPCRRSALYLPVEGWGAKGITFRVKFFFFSSVDCTRDDTIDIAVCRSPDDIRQRIGRDPAHVALNTTLQDDGTAIAFTGFPLNNVIPITSRGFTAAYRATADGSDPGELIIDKPGWPGASGSTVYIENGDVVGLVVQRGIGDAIGITISRPASLIERVLAKRQQSQKN